MDVEVSGDDDNPHIKHEDLYITTYRFNARVPITSTIPDLLMTVRRHFDYMVKRRREARARDIVVGDRAPVIETSEYIEFAVVRDMEGQLVPPETVGDYFSESDIVHLVVPIPLAVLANHLQALEDDGAVEEVVPEERVKEKSGKKRKRKKVEDEKDELIDLEEVVAVMPADRPKAKKRKAAKMDVSSPLKASPNIREDDDSIKDSEALPDTEERKGKKKKGRNSATAEDLALSVEVSEPPKKKRRKSDNKETFNNISPAEDLTPVPKMSRKKAKLIDQDIGDRATPTKDMKYSAQKEDESDKKLTPRKLRWGKTDKNHAAEVGEPGSMTKAAKEDAEETTPAPKKEKSKKTEELDRKVKQADRKENPFITKQTSDDEEQNTNEDENEENEKDDGDNMNVDEKPAQESNPSSLLELITQDPEILAEEFQNDDTSTPADSPQKESVDSKASSVADGTLVGEEDDGMGMAENKDVGEVEEEEDVGENIDEDGEEEVDELSEEKADDEQEEDGEEEEEGDGLEDEIDATSRDNADQEKDELESAEEEQESTREDSPELEDPSANTSSPVSRTSETGNGVTTPVEGDAEAEQMQSGNTSDNEDQFESGRNSGNEEEMDPEIILDSQATQPVVEEDSTPMYWSQKPKNKEVTSIDDSEEEEEPPAKEDTPPDSPPLFSMPGSQDQSAFSLASVSVLGKRMASPDLDDDEQVEKSQFQASNITVRAHASFSLRDARSRNSEPLPQSRTFLPKPTAKSKLSLQNLANQIAAPRRRTSFSQVVVNKISNGFTAIFGQDSRAANGFEMEDDEEEDIAKKVYGREDEDDEEESDSEEEVFGRKKRRSGLLQLSQSAAMHKSTRPT